MSRRAGFASLVLAVISALVFTTRADAVYIAREGDQIVVRPDVDELLKDVEVVANADRTAFTITKRFVVDDIGTPHAGPGCDAGGAPTCVIGDAKTLKIELGEGDQQALVQDSPIPVIFDGGTGGDRPTITNAPSLTAIGGTGNDIIKVSGVPQSTIDGGDGGDTIEVTGGTAQVTAGAGDDTVRALATTGSFTADGGTGNDELEATTPGATLTGGDGNDTFVTASVRSPSKQTIDCGAGTDIADVDGSDVVGAGCGPAFTKLSKSTTVARFGTDGTIAVNSAARVPNAANVRLAVEGPRLGGMPKSFSGTFATSTLRLSAGGKVSATLKPSASIRKLLGKRRAAVTKATVRLELYAPGKTTGDRTIVKLPGTLRPK